MAAAMSNLSMMEARLPPGFRFHPREEELICDYLVKKASGAGDVDVDGNGSCALIIDVDLNKCEPWDLPDMACVGGKEWYFFNLRDRKYATGQRTNRATQSGYWKATGKDRQVKRRGMLVGMRKTLVFYQGRAPKGRKTDWVMHEFRMEGTATLTKFSFKEDRVLCRVFYKSRSGGEQAAASKPAGTNELPCHDLGAASSLPPLMDTFMHQSFQCYGSHEVPCFPGNHLAPPSINNGAAGAPHLPADDQFPTTTTTTTTTTTRRSTCPQEHLGPCDRKNAVLLKAVLSHFAKLEASPTGEEEILPSMSQENLESYLSTDHGVMPHMWFNSY